MCLSWVCNTLLACIHMQDASSSIQDSIKKSQGGKTNEADQLADKLNTGAPASGVPSTAGVGKNLGTTDGGL